MITKIECPRCSNDYLNIKAHVNSNASRAVSNYIQYCCTKCGYLWREERD